MKCGDFVHEILWNQFGYGVCYFCKTDILQPIEQKSDVCFNCGCDLMRTPEFVVCTSCGEISYEMIYPHSQTKKSIYTPEKVWLPYVFNRINKEFDLPISFVMQSLIVNVINQIRSNEVLMKGRKRLSGYLNICAHLLFEVGFNVEETGMKKYYLHKRHKKFWKHVMKTSIGDYVKEKTIELIENETAILFK